MNSRPEVRVLIVDDSKPFADALRSYLRQWKRLVVVGQASDGAEALKLIEAERPDLVVMDMVMPRMNGLAATRELRRLGHRPKVLIVTMHKGADFAAQAFAAGADAFASKHDFHEAFGGHVEAWFGATLDAHPERNSA